MYVCHECGRDNSNNMKNGGWLDSYADGGSMQEHQENYNDNSVSLPEGFVGDGYNTKGRDYSPAWGGQFQDGGAIYVSSENDPRYKSYADSLYNYNIGNKLKSVVKSIPSLVEIKKGSPYDKALQKTLMKSKNRGLVDNTKNPNSKTIDPRIQALMKEYQKKANKGIKPIRYNSFIDDPDNGAIDLITGRGFTDMLGITKERPKGYNIPEWKKPKQKVVVKPETKKSSGTPIYNPSEKRWEVEGTIKRQPKKKVEVVQPDLPMVEAINLPPMQNQDPSFLKQELDLIRPIQAPKSYNVNMQRYNMQGPSDYYNYNQEGVDYETAMRVQRATEAYNKYIEEKYGNEEALKNPKAAERLKQLRQDVQLTPQYQMGGSVYPVNYVPQAQDGKKLNPFTYPKPDYNYNTNPFLVRDPQHGIFIGGINPTYSTKDFSIGASTVGVGNKDFIKPIVDYGIRGSYNPTDSLSINANLSKNNVGAGVSYRFQEGGSLPGASGMMYARQGAPSNGPYAKKTMASAQEGRTITIDEGEGKKRKILTDSSEYAKLYDEGRIGVQNDDESISFNPLNEVVVTPYDKQYPFYQELSDEEKKYFNSDTPIGRQLRSRAQDNVGFNADKATDFAMGWLRDLPLASLQAPQSALVEGVEALRGNDFNMLSALEPDKQRIPSETWGIENPYAAFAVDALTDPETLMGMSLLKNPLQKGIKQLGNIPTSISPELRQGLRTAGPSFGFSTDNVNFNIAESAKKWTPEIENITKKEISYITSPEYLETRMTNTGESKEEVLKSIDKILKNVNKTDIGIFDSKYLPERHSGDYLSPGIINKLLPKEGGFFPAFNSKGKIRIDKNGFYDEVLGTLNHEIKHAFSPVSTGQLSYSKYKNYPTIKIKVPEDKYFEKYLNLPEEQQVRFNKMKDYMEEAYGIKKGTKFTDEDIVKLTDDIYEGRVNRRKYADVLDFLDNIDPEQRTRQKLKEVLNKSWGIVPGSIGLGAASQMEEEPIPGMKQGGAIKDDRGQWAHPGEITEINSNQITMKGVPYPVLGISDTGDTQMMYPEEEYEFEGNKVTEYPLAKDGKELVKLNQLTNFTNYNTKQPGGWLDKY
jgi:hypothetical protein